MSHYTRMLNASVERDRACRAAQAQADRAAEVNAARDRLTPLDDRLRRLLASIPAEVRSAGLSLPSLQTMLKGRWRGHAHPGEVGAALRRLGWTRQRCWRRGPAGFSALWFPPD